MFSSEVKETGSELLTFLMFIPVSCCLYFHWLRVGEDEVKKWDRWSLTHTSNCTWILTKLFLYYFSFQTAPLPSLNETTLSLSLSHTHTHTHTIPSVPSWWYSDVSGLILSLTSVWMLMCVLYGHQVIIHQQMAHYLLLLTPSVSFPTFFPKNTFFM